MKHSFGRQVSQASASCRHRNGWPPSSFIQNLTHSFVIGIFEQDGENDEEMQVMCIVDSDRYMIDKPAQEIDSELLKECIE